MNTAEFLFPYDLEVTPTSLGRVLIIGSCLSEIYRAFFRSMKPDVVFDYILFNNSADLPPSPPSSVESYDLQYIQIPLRSVVTDAIISAKNLNDTAFLHDLFGMAKQNIDAMLHSAMQYNVASGLLSLVSGFVVPQVRVMPSLSSDHTELDLTYLVRELNAYLANTLKTYKNAVFVDVDMIASSLGKRYFLDDSIYFYSHNVVFLPHWADAERMPHWTAPQPGRIEDLPSLDSLYESKMHEYFEAVYRQIEAAYRVIRQIDTVKVVIFDLDNTLWRGQIAEHYEPGRQWPDTHGWPLGIWEAVHHLKWRGIVVAIASKNDAEIVAERWDHVVQPAFLKLADFFKPRINWLPKVDNVAEILHDLNVTAASAVFVDDNPVERESVKAAFPQIRTIGSNPFLTRRILLWSAETQVASLTEESSRREVMLKAQVDREAQKATMNRGEFLQSLQCRVPITELLSIDQTIFTRTLELLNKTNQFNTTGQRWNAAEIKTFLDQKGRVFTFTVQDRFVEYGLVGVVLVQADAIKQFVMSCRVLGLDVEVAALGAIIRSVREGRAMVGQIVPTEANTPCRDVFAKCNFSKVGEHDSAFQLASLAEPTTVDHVTVSWTSQPLSPCKSPAVARSNHPATKGPADYARDIIVYPVGEVFNGATFFDGTRTSVNPQAGGWFIPAGQTGALTYHRYHFPIQRADLIAGCTAHFCVVLRTTPDLCSSIGFLTDFTPHYTKLGRAGLSSNPSVVPTSTTQIDFAWDYVFSGAETCVVGALQVAPSNAPVPADVSVLCVEQAWELRSHTKRDANFRKVFAGLTGILKRQA